MSIGAGLTAAERDQIRQQAVSVLPGSPDARYLLTCEHASLEVPGPWNRLGLSREAIEDHIGWDIGARRVTELLAQAIGAPAVFAGYSRLFVECNRVPGSRDFVAPQSGGVRVPGNQDLDADEIACRKELAFDPFHDRLAAMLDDWPGEPPAVISVHSFTPCLGADKRPWYAGVLWKQDSRLAARVFDRLRSSCSGPVGFNEPYDANLYETMTLDHQILPRGLRHVVFEIRNDLIQNEAGCKEWANLLAFSLHES